VNQQSTADETPVTLTSPIKKDSERIMDNDLDILCEEVWRGYSVTTEQANYIEGPEGLNVEKGELRQVPHMMCMFGENLRNQKIL
jgi:hypothetical protein